MKKKVIIAMSGGVDSSVAAYLMIREGYECAGATMKLYDKPQDISIPVYKIAGPRMFPGIFLNKRSVISIGNKTDILAFRLIRVDKSLFLGNPADLRFRIAAKGKKRMGKLILIHGIKNIALVLGGIQTFFKKISSGIRILLNTGIVAAGDILRAQLAGFLKKGVKF